MTEKLPCNKCGVEILPDTFERTGGMCMPCSQGKDPAADRSMGALKAHPLGKVVIGLGIAAFGAVIFWFLTWFESTGESSVRVPWFIAVAYLIGGKYVVASIFVALGMLVAISALWTGKK